MIKAVKKDISKVHDLQIKWRKENIPYGFIPSPIDNLNIYIGNYFWVAEMQGTIIGYIYGKSQISSGTSIIPKRRKYIEIEDIYVTSKYRKKSVVYC